jgi:hypothetical protein
MSGTWNLPLTLTGSRWRFDFLFMPRALILALFIMGGLRLAGGELVDSGPFTSRDGAHWVMTNGRPVMVKINPAAKDPTLAAVIAFVKADRTNQIPYVPGTFVCSEFAVRLHDNAERAGLRAAIVFVSFATGPGHALIAFHTRDHGLVFVDCTGGTADNPASGPGGFDTFGYLVKGRPYGRLPLDLGITDPVSYAFYEKIRTARAGIQAWSKWADQERVVLGAESAEIARLESRPLAPEQAAQVKARIDQFNERTAAYNSRIETLNRFIVGVQENYLHNPEPVKDFEVRW